MKPDRTSWIGQREGPRLEFKRGEVHDDVVLEQVVGLLNTAGGRVVLGVDAPDGVAIGVPGVADADARVRALRERVQSRIEPRPGSRVEVARNDNPDGSACVTLDVHKSDVTHAVRAQGGYRVMIRTGDATRALDFREICDRVRRESGQLDDSAARKEAHEALRDALDRARAGANGQPGFLFVGFRALTPPALDSTRRKALRQAVSSELAQRNPLGVRSSGWNLALWPNFPPELGRTEVTIGREAPLFRFARSSSDGLVWGAMGSPQGWGPFEDCKTSAGGDVTRVPELALVEFTLAIARLAEFVFAEHGVHGRVEALVHVGTRFPVRPRVQHGRFFEEPFEDEGRRLTKSTPVEVMASLEAAGAGGEGGENGDRVPWADRAARELLGALLDEAIGVAGVDGSLVVERYLVGGRVVLQG